MKILHTFFSSSSFLAPFFLMKVSVSRCWTPRLWNKYIIHSQTRYTTDATRNDINEIQVVGFCFKVQSCVAWQWGYILRNASLGDFYHCANIIECTYTNPDSIAMLITGSLIILPDKNCTHIYVMWHEHNGHTHILHTAYRHSPQEGSVLMTRSQVDIISWKYLMWLHLTADSPSLLFWDVMWHRLTATDRRYVTTYLFHLVNS
jgi:hypothetical protein